MTSSVQNIWLGAPLLEVGTLIAPSTTAVSAALDITAVPGAVGSRLRIALRLGATDTVFTTLKLVGSYDGTNYYDVVGSRYGTDNDINNNASTLPGATSDDNWYGWDVNLQGGAGNFPDVGASGPGPFRYYKISYVTSSAGSTGANVCAFAEYGPVSNTIGNPDFNQGFAEMLAVPLVTPITH